MFLKAVYLINLLLFLAVMGFVSVKQNRGNYHCESFTVQSKCPYLSYSVLLLPYNTLLTVFAFSHFAVGRGNEVWGEAYVHYPANSVQYPGGKILTQPLDFSFFNGHYRLDESRTR